MKKCPECDVDVADGRKFCGKCGAPMGESTQTLDPLAAAPAESPPGSPPEAAVEAVADGKAPAPELQPLEPQPTPITVIAACKHVRGNCEEKNDQDYCLTEEIEYPLHGFKVVVSTGNDGIGTSTGGERWAATTAHLFLAAISARMPAQDRENRFQDRDQFWQLLNEKAKTWFMPVADWVHKNIYAMGAAEVGKDSHGNVRLFGCTWVAQLLLCDLVTGKVALWAYAIGDSNLYLISPDGVEKLNVNHERKVGPKMVLDRWVGSTGPSANGQLITREFQLNPQTLPSLALASCSDGISNMISDEETGQIARKHEQPDQAVDAIIYRALTVGVPFGRQFQDPQDDNPIKPGDDNAFVTLTKITVQPQGEGETV